MASDDYVKIGGLTFRDFSKFIVVDFDQGAETVETSDLVNPVFDDTYAGVDMFRAPTYTFTFAVLGDTEAEVYDLIGQVKKVWRNPAWAKKGGELAELELGIAGRERLVYGRPRRFAATPARTAPYRYAHITAEFQLMDPIVYDRRWRNERLDMVPPTIRGLSEPLTEPLSTGGYSQRQGVIEEIGGTAPTPFMIDVTAGAGGIISSPSVSINSNKYEFDTEIREGRSLRIDSRRGTASISGSNRLSTMRNRTRLKSARLPNGSVEVSFGGVNPALDAHATFWWRPAYYSL